MKIELLALLDLMEVLITRNHVQKIHEDQIQTLLDKYREAQPVEQIQEDIQNKNYDQVLALIESYRLVCKELLTIYHAMTKDYLKLRDDNLNEEIVEILNEKYGVSKVKEVVNLFELKHRILSTPKLQPVR